MLDSFYFEMLEEDAELRSRPLLGVEVLNMQGLDVRWLTAERACASFKNGDSTKLAGNAFAASQFAVAFVASLSILGDHLPTKQQRLKAIGSRKYRDLNEIFDKVAEEGTKKAAAPSEETIEVSLLFLPCCFVVCACLFALCAFS